jgi:hypothetical protein
VYAATGLAHLPAFVFLLDMALRGRWVQLVTAPGISNRP